MSNKTLEFVLPSGLVLPFAGSAAPTGWLLCHGQAVSRTTYVALFNVIGTTYGVGDGSTTFNVPDLRGRVIAGKDNMGGSAANRLTSGGSGVNGATLGAAGGAQTHTLTTDEMPAHTHSEEGMTNDGNQGGGGSAARNGTTQNTGSTGGGAAHNNVQPTIILNYVIKI